MDRRWIPLAASLAAALGVWWYYAARPGNWSDFDQLWLAGRALVAGANPYAAVPQSFRWPLYYPLPAVLVTLPLVALPLPLARAVFGGVTAGLASWALCHHRPQALLLLLSCPFLYALDRGQWSPVILAACLVPALGAVLAVKPTVAAAAWLYRPSRVALIGAGVLALASLAVLPSWPLDWLDSLRTMRHFRSPVLLPWGFVLLLAAFKWRRPEARLFLLLATVPQTVVPYELVPLAVVPETRRETLIVALCWNLAYLFRVALNPAPLLTYANVGPHYFPDHWGAELAFGYLPILLLILRRPNRPACRATQSPVRQAHEV
jgi:hypothetical protein